MNMESVKEAIRKEKNFKLVRSTEHINKQQQLAVKFRNQEVNKCREKMLK